MGLLSRFEGRVEDTVEGAAERMGSSSLSPVQIAKKAEKQMRREKIVGAGKQYAPTLYTILVSVEDDQRLFGYYPTLAGEIETYLQAKATENGFVLDGHPLVRFIADGDLKAGKFEVVAELVAAPLIKQLREEEMQRYGISGMNRPRRRRAAAPQEQEPMTNQNSAAAGYQGYTASAQAQGGYDEPQTMMFDDQAQAQDQASLNIPQPGVDYEVYLYDITNDRAFTLTGEPMTIGRESRCEVVIPDANVSRTHAEIRMDPATGTWIISDLGSTNGTFVNGRQIKSKALRDADQLIIGTTELEFQIL